MKWYPIDIHNLNRGLEVSCPCISRSPGQSASLIQECWRIGHPSKKNGPILPFTLFSCSRHMISFNPFPRWPQFGYNQIITCYQSVFFSYFLTKPVKSDENIIRSWNHFLFYRISRNNNCVEKMWIQTKKNNSVESYLARDCGAQPFGKEKK